MIETIVQVLDYNHLYGLLIFTLTLCFIIFLAISVFANRFRVKFYRLLVNQNGKIDKSGLTFVFVLLILVYQATIVGQISTEIVYILCLAMGYDVGRKFLASKNGTTEKDEDTSEINISQGDIDELEHKLKNVKPTSAKATLEDDETVVEETNSKTQINIEDLQNQIKNIQEAIKTKIEEVKK